MDLWISMDKGDGALPELLLWKERPTERRDVGLDVFWGNDDYNDPVLEFCYEEWFAITGIKIKAGELHRVRLTRHKNGRGFSFRVAEDNDVHD